MKKILWTLLIAVSALFYACDDDSSSPRSSKVSFYLTDAPTEADYKAVLIDVQAVSYSVDGKGWVMLPVRPVQVDLLRYANGTDTLLSNIALRAGERVEQIRLQLGNANRLVLKDGTQVNLDTPSGQSSGYKVNVHAAAEVTSGYKVVIDFDAARSIVARGNGTYGLKPVVRAFIEANLSSISGKLLPADLPTRVFTVTAQKDTVATISDTTRANYFLLRGLPTGSYDIQVQNLTGGQISPLKSGVEVVGGTDIDLGVLDLPM